MRSKLGTGQLLSGLPGLPLSPAASDDPNPPLLHHPRASSLLQCQGGLPLSFRFTCQFLIMWVLLATIITQTGGPGVVGFTLQSIRGMRPEVSTHQAVKTSLTTDHQSFKIVMVPKETQQVTSAQKVENQVYLP